MMYEKSARKGIKECQGGKQKRMGQMVMTREKYIQQRGGHKVTITLGKKCVA
jgi:hypothetical protein